MNPSAIPVILNTDLGDDIDDFWALSMMVRSKELRPLLVNTEFRDTRWRAKIAAKFLELAGRADIPVSAGLRQSVYGPDEGRQRDFIVGYDLNDYPGVYRTDGAQAIIDAIAKAGDQEVTLVAISPVPTLAAVVAQAPECCRRVRLVGMFGSIQTGYVHDGKSPPAAEWNVAADVASARTVFAAPWKAIVLTPLDTCGRVHLTGDAFEQAMTRGDAAQQAVAQSSKEWSGRDGNGFVTETSTLYDTVAVHLSHSEQFLEMENMRLRITDDGFTVRDPEGFAARVAMRWTDYDGYCRYLADRLVSPVCPP